MTDFQESIRIARRTDLADYLVTNHPTEVVVTGHSVYLKAHSSIYTKFGYCGYTRFSSMETGNSIDCLVRYLNYSFRDAVNELASKGRSIPIKNPASLSTVGKSFEIPKSAQWPYNRVYAYLRLQITSSSFSFSSVIAMPNSLSNTDFLSSGLLSPDRSTLNRRIIFSSLCSSSLSRFKMITLSISASFSST